MLIALSSIAAIPSIGFKRVFATTTANFTLTDFTIFAIFSAWNNSEPSGPNPTVNEFNATSFLVHVHWSETYFIDHDFAIYPLGILPASVFPGNPTALVRSAIVDMARPDAQLKTKINQTGVYEYYCEFHPFSMHGKMNVLNSIDLNHDKRITISDVAILAAAFGTKVVDPSFNPAADINLDGRVDITDANLVASNWKRQFSC